MRKFLPAFRFGAVLLVGGTLVACAGINSNVAERSNLLSFGMDKSDVVEIMGVPSSTRMQAGIEYLIYERWSNCGYAVHMGIKPSYGLCGVKHPDFFVRLIRGRVEAFGELGDFDSTKDPSVDIDLDIE